jgi:hypothetical protein
MNLQKFLSKDWWDKETKVGSSSRETCTLAKAALHMIFAEEQTVTTEHITNELILNIVDGVQRFRCCSWANESEIEERRDTQ